MTPAINHQPSTINLPVWPSRLEFFREQQWQMAQELMATARLILQQIRADPEPSRASLSNQALKFIQLASALVLQASGQDPKNKAAQAAPASRPPLTPEQEAELTAAYGPSNPATDHLDPRTYLPQFQKPAPAPEPGATPAPADPQPNPSAPSAPAANPPQNAQPAKTEPPSEPNAQQPKIESPFPTLNLPPPARPMAPNPTPANRPSNPQPQPSTIPTLNPLTAAAPPSKAAAAPRSTAESPLSEPTCSRSLHRPILQTSTSPAKAKPMTLLHTPAARCLRASGQGCIKLHPASRRSADFQVCRIAGFQTCGVWAFQPPADLEVGDTAGLETCATCRA